MHIHKIDKQTHHNFLEEERKDPITGDLIEIGSEVVFCARCKSAFLKESWNYIKREHCGQKNTLKKFPAHKALLLNVSTIAPNFLTLTHLTISSEHVFEILSPFKPNTKKVNIVLDEMFRKGYQGYSKLLERTKKKIDQEKDFAKIKQISLDKEEAKERAKQSSWSIGGSILLGLVTSFLPATVLKESSTIFLFLLGMIVFIHVAINGYFFTIKTILLQKIKRERKILIEKSELLNHFEAESSITFGINNYHLFFYDTHTKDYIFIELARIDKIEVHYKVDCYLYLVLIHNSFFSKEVEIPLIFSKSRNIEKFLVELAEVRDRLGRVTNIVLNNFPTDHKKILQNALKSHPEVTFE